MKRTLLAVVLLALAPLCFAPIEDKPQGAQFHGELTDAQMEAAQRGEVVSATPSGGSSVLEDQKADIPAATTDADASKIIANASATEVLKKAEADVKDQQGAKVRPFIVGGSALLLVGGLLFGAKVWLDKSVPGGNG
ncbi:MAG: hypothetical protein KF857_01435 [Fimbriimonadaceae bacterium]|nr:hypothetical protein [Fimbriimonadaceae bacterium]